MKMILRQTQPDTPAVGVSLILLITCARKLATLYTNLIAMTLKPRDIGTKEKKHTPIKSSELMHGWHI